MAPTRNCLRAGHPHVADALADGVTVVLTKPIVPVGALPRKRGHALGRGGGNGFPSDLSDTVDGVIRMTATEAARSFSDLLNRVAAGEEIEVVRSGAEVAVISPARQRLMSAARFRELIASAPRPDDKFADEIRAARASVAPPEDAWAS